jgi:hypothetical protein
MTARTLTRPLDPEPSLTMEPPARRLRRPSWRDPRLLVGLLLVLLSVTGVTGLVRAVDTSEPVFVARRQSPPGHEHRL